jgi:MoaA/NifB/PqqE/SkfB family radical SAM enzyme
VGNYIKMPFIGKVNCLFFNPIVTVMNLLKVGQYKRYYKYYRYGKLSKHLNLIKAVYNWLTEKEVITTKPAFLKVEISRECGLACPFCLAKKEDGIFFPLTEYKKLIDKLKNYIYLVSLYDIGEPFENPTVCQYISYARQNNIGSTISSHMSLEKPDSFWEELVLSGLHTLIVAVDGTTPEIYNRYRMKGNFDLAISNIKKVVHYKQLHKSKMVVEWQIISFPWNQHQLAGAKVMAKELGCDSFRVIADASVRKKYKKENAIRKRNCILPYLIFIVDAYNRVRPCYKFYKTPNFTGNYSDGGFENNWNNDQMQIIRCSKKIGGRDPCSTCIES